MATVGDRIQWILASRHLSQRELARRSGLPLAHIGVILNRARKNAAASIESDTLTAIARGGGVSLQWLATGEGSLECSSREPVGRGVLGDLPGWYESEALVRRMLEDTPEWVFECARNLSTISRPVKADGELVMKAVMLCRSFEPPIVAANDASPPADGDAEHDGSPESTRQARRR